MFVFCYTLLTVRIVQHRTYTHILTHAGETDLHRIQKRFHRSAPYVSVWVVYRYIIQFIGTVRSVCNNNYLPLRFWFSGNQNFTFVSLHVRKEGHFRAVVWFLLVYLFDCSNKY